MTYHLRVVVKQAKDFGHYKCSVRMQVGYEYNWIPKYYKTPTVKTDKSGLAVWNVGVDCIVNNPQKDQLKVMLRSEEILAEGMIGEAFYHLHSLSRGVPVDVWLPLFRNNKPHGQINLELTALDFGQVPVVTTTVVMQPQAVPVPQPAVAYVPQASVPQGQVAYQPMVGSVVAPPPPTGLYPPVAQPVQSPGQPPPPAYPPPPNVSVGASAPPSTSIPNGGYAVLPPK